MHVETPPVHQGGSGYPVLWYLGEISKIRRQMFSTNLKLFKEKNSKIFDQSISWILKMPVGQLLLKHVFIKLL